jgi:hypothetical protein
MRVAGLRLADGTAVWADARDHQLEALDSVCVELDGECLIASVFVSPDQWLRPPSPTRGTVLAILEIESSGEPDMDLSGADLPPLGSCVSARGLTGIVTGLAPIERLVTITTAGGSSAQVPVDEVGVVQPEGPHSHTY